MSKYGIPYQGSKDKIADWILSLLPDAEVFVDLFAGGCAMTHAAMLSGKYKRFIVNDINPLPTQCFLDAIAGKYKDRYEWVSREQFRMLKDADPFVKYCWSFGSDGKSYLYSKEIEPYKKALHEMLTCDNISERRTKYRKVIYKLDVYLKNAGDGVSLQSLESLQRLQSLERLQSLQSLESLESLERLQRLEKDYREVEIPDNAVIYCDIPYRDTKGYDCGIDYDAFYDWCRAQKQDVYISEYSMPDDFEIVGERKRQNLMNTKSRYTGNEAVERLYVKRNSERR